MTTIPTTEKEANPVTGHELRRLLHGQRQWMRAHIAASLVFNRQTLADLSPIQAARLCSVNVGNVSVALGNRDKRGPRNKTIDRIIRRYGADALMRGLDRATSPQRVAAE